MALRVRKDGTIICAAKSKEEEGDTYLNNDIHHKLSVLTEAIIPDSNKKENGIWHWNYKLESLSITKKTVLCNSR